MNLLSVLEEGRNVIFDNNCDYFMDGKMKFIDYIGLFERFFSL